MKTSASAVLCGALVLSALLSCETLDPTGFFYLREKREGSNTDESETLKFISLPDSLFIFDTTILFCTVEVPMDYDWRNDSAYYSRNGAVCFYRDFEKVFEVKTGTETKMSYYADKHHIIGKDLYSEYADNRGTFISKNGILLFSYSEKEILKGLLPRGEDIYTLGQNPGTGTVCYRKNGQILKRLEGGFVTGDFFNPAYGETGALYVDDSLLCFGFVSDEEGRSNEGYLVRNGEQVRVCSGSKVLDVRSVSGSGKYILYGGMATDVFSGWKTASFYLIGRDVFTAGVDMNGNSVVLSSNRIVTMQNGDESTIYPTDKGWAFVSGTSVQAIGDYYLSNGACVCRGGGKMWYALTPRSSGRKPAIWADGRLWELDVNGFVSGIKVKVSRTIAKAGTDPPEP